VRTARRGPHATKEPAAMPEEANHRLDRVEATLEHLAQRQQALTETVEIVAGMQRASERRLEALDRQIGETMVAIGRLLQIAQIH
jgi:hypothetical protein